MSIIIKRTLYFALFSILFLLVGIHIIDNVMQYSDSNIQDYFKEKDLDATIMHHNTPNGIIRIVKSGETSKATIICIHGAPGGWDAYKGFMTDSSLLSKAEIISYDRPGYGPLNNVPITSLSDQAILLNEIIEKYAKSESIILLSHSYGGPIAARYLANDQQKNVTHIMVAPCIDPESEKYFWVSPLGYWKATKWLMPYNYITASYEKYTHVAELTELKPLIKNIQSKTIHIHGLNDWLAPAKENINYVKLEFPKNITEQIVLEDAGHLLIWDEKELIKAKILEILQ